MIDCVPQGDCVPQCSCVLQTETRIVKRTDVYGDTYYQVEIVDSVGNSYCSIPGYFQSVEDIKLEFERIKEALSKPVIDKTN